MTDASIQELEALCEQCSKSYRLIARLSYWTAEVYGFGKHIRQYAYYPGWLPLCINTDHGPGFRDVPLPQELETTAPVQLYHAFSRVIRWRMFSKKSCYCMYSPYVFFRRKNGIHKKAEAAGTIAFPAHTTDSIDDVSNIQDYMNQLRKLPMEYQPVSICLHMTDIGKGLHKKFRENGFQVYTAGNVYDEKFTERFYQIIQNFKYATSNIGGAYLYYCVEMGLPFFLYGNEPVYMNKSDINVEKGQYTSYKLQLTYMKMVELFSSPMPEITQEQKIFVENGLGLNDGIGRLRMCWILYWALIKCIFGLVWLKYLFRRVIRK